MVWKRFYCCCETEKVAEKFKGPKLYDLFYFISRLIKKSPPLSVHFILFYGVSDLQPAGISFRLLGSRYN